MITITINDRQIQAEEGQTILEVARAEGIHIPTLCYHRDLTPYGACRLCMVEIVQGVRPRVDAACLYKVTEGLVIQTDSERVRRARRMMLELHLARCPESEVVRELAAEYGITETRIKLKKQDTCILCGQCVRVCAEVTRRSAISFVGRGSRRRVTTPFDKESPTCIGCGACAYLCPTKTIKVEEA